MTEHDDTRYERMLAAYRDGLRRPGDEVRQRVMAELAGRRQGAAHRAWWRWFVQPHTVRVRPMLAAAALVIVVGLSAAVGQLLVDGNGAAVPAGTVLVQFELEFPQAETVALAGSFNDWSDSATQFTRHEGSGVWSVTIPLAPGRHEYLFVVDGERWIPDPRAHAAVDDGFGNLNSMIVVGPRGVVRS
jgi:hypothetical protein